MPGSHIARVALGVSAVLLIPLALTLVNPNASIYGGPGGGFDWMPGDFVIMGVLLFAAGLAISFAVRKLADPAAKIAAVVAILAALFAIWVELAVDGVSQLIRFLFG